VSSHEAGSARDREWTWDSSLYAGSATFYAAGRVAYPAQLADLLVAALQLDGSGRLLDVGCGPGSLTLLLAPHFAEAIGVDADADMLAEAARLAQEGHVRNVSWRQLRAEDLPADLPSVRVVVFAQSFHWMDRPRVAAAARSMLLPGGAVCTSTPARTEVSTVMPLCSIRNRLGMPSLNWCSVTSDRSDERDEACWRRGQHPGTRM
jgi:2-polyprenyl-3-methyl-5-hydroxy-6-metoxy-1,4-benzoquinol methylase